MSVVTDIIVLASVEEADIIVLASVEEAEGIFDNQKTEYISPALDFLNAAMKDKMGRHDTLKRLNGYEGGGKAWQCEVWGGAFNHFDLRAFLGLIHGAPWKDADQVQVLIKQEDEDQFMMVSHGDAWETLYSGR